MKSIVPLALLSFAFARIALAADAPPSEVIHLDHDKVAAAFAQGGPLLANAKYKISAGRRVATGPVELHALDTDIFYIVDGSATFVTGGTVSDPQTTAPNEIRGKAIIGGETRHLAKGDVIIIPKGTPHWFTEVNGTFLYFVVKVTE